MSRHPLAALLLISLALTLVACGGQTAASQPTQQPAPSPRPTRIRATATPAPTRPGAAPATAVPPTAIPTADPTAVPTADPTAGAAAPTAAAGAAALAAPTAAGGAPADSVAAAAIRKALLRTAQAKSYRIELDVSAKGLPPELTDGMTLGGSQTIALITVNGAIQGQDAQLKVAGLLAAFLGADPAKGIEAMQVGGKSYVRGPLPMIGATEARWYSADAATSSFSSTSSQPDEILTDFERDFGAALAGMVKSGSEPLDGRQCDVYTGDKAMIEAVIAEANSSGDIDDAGQIKNAEVRVWICDDGYFHQARAQLEGAPKDLPGQDVSLALLLRMYDFDRPVAIVAPANPAPLGEPDFSSSPLLGGMLPGGTPGAVTAPPPSPGSPSAIVFNGGNIRSEPSLNSKMIYGQLHAGEQVSLISKTADGRWYNVVAPAAAGWVSASLLTIDPATAQQVPVASGSSTAATGLTATVFNGGNVRAAPSLSGQVLDQINARETVQLLGKTADGRWFKITNVRGNTGWVSRTLLTIGPAVEQQVPVA